MEGKIMKSIILALALITLININIAGAPKKSLDKACHLLEKCTQ